MVIFPEVSGGRNHLLGLCVTVNINKNNQRNLFFKFQDKIVVKKNSSLKK
jgi:hypothetical protein